MILALALAAATPAFSAEAADRATVTVEDVGIHRTMPVETVQQALAILADRRFAAIWPAVIDWAGPGLERLRDANIARAEAAVAKGGTKVARDTSASSVRPAVRAALMLADALRAAGRVPEAQALLERVRGAAPAKGAWGRIEWTITSVRLANLRTGLGDYAGAIAILDASLPPLGEAPEAANIAVNRAALLALSGRAAEALVAVDAAQARFDGPTGGGMFVRNVRVPGSDRQFGWIRACALSKLGRTVEAMAAAAPLYPPIEPSDKRLVIAPTVKLREQLARCTGDVAGAARAYAEEIATTDPDDTALLALQPDLRQPEYDPTFMAAVRADPGLAQLLAERMRKLPADLIPALNDWQSPSSRN